MCKEFLSKVSMVSIHSDVFKLIIGGFGMTGGGNDLEEGTVKSGSSVFGSSREMDFSSNLKPWIWMEKQIMGNTCYPKGWWIGEGFREGEKVVLTRHGRR